MARSSKGTARSSAETEALRGGIDPASVEDWNAEDASELAIPGQNPLVVSSRDWTIETIVNQVRAGNVDLDPSFQRRNAWRDDRRSRLIESFLLQFPVPQIVLAENPRRPGSFIVIDGKQRLLTISSLYLPDYASYWRVREFSGLQALRRLNGESLEDFLTKDEFDDERRQLANSAIRTAVLSNFKNEDVLYNVFYRLNTGSVPLSSQELRQVLNRGGFARHLLDVTASENPLWGVLNLEAPDDRLRDVELLLRLIAWRRYADQYVGNMKPFLDFVMKDLNDRWEAERPRIARDVRNVFAAVEAAVKIFSKQHVGRRYRDARFERALNRSVFEVQVWYLLDSDTRRRAVDDKAAVVSGFKRLSEDDAFEASVTSTTKSIENYSVRFALYRKMLIRALGLKGVPQLTVG